MAHFCLFMPWVRNLKIIASYKRLTRVLRLVVGVQCKSRGKNTSTSYAQNGSHPQECIITHEGVRLLYSRTQQHKHPP